MANAALGSLGVIEEYFGARLGTGDGDISAERISRLPIRQLDRLGTLLREASRTFQGADGLTAFARELEVVVGQEFPPAMVIANTLADPWRAVAAGKQIVGYTGHVLLDDPLDTFDTFDTFTFRLGHGRSSDRSADRAKVRATLEKLTEVRPLIAGANMLLVPKCLADESLVIGKKDIMKELGGRAKRHEQWVIEGLVSE